MPYLLRLFRTILLQLSPVIVLGVLLSILVKCKEKLPKWLYVIFLVILIILLVLVIGFLVLLNIAVFHELASGDLLPHFMG